MLAPETAGDLTNTRSAPVPTPVSEDSGDTDADLHGVRQAYHVSHPGTGRCHIRQLEGDNRQAGPRATLACQWHLSFVAPGRQ